MSLRYPGGVVSATPPTLQSGAGASGAWTLEQQLQAIAAGKWPVNGPFYIEDVFSTYLWTGNGSSQTITNGIDLSGKGGLVWLKGRSVGYNNGLFDTIRGADYLLCSNNTDPSTSVSGIPANPWITGFNANGFGIGANGSANNNGTTYVSWTFRKQPKFFDVVTYTGNGTTQAISHNLGSVPGFIIIKKTNSAEDWWCFHRYDFTYRTKLNATNAAVNTTSAKYLGNNVTDVAPTSTTFTVGDTGGLNGSGDTFVAYLFAHNAGGFGLTGSDNVISCGSYTGNGSTTGPVVTLNYEPQLVMVKRTDAASNWTIFDTMRGMSQTSANLLYPNLADDEGIGTQGWVVPTATGFQLAITQSSVNANGGTYIYIAIRRGPMKTPTSGTSVFNPNAYTATGTNNRVFTDVGFSPDWSIFFDRSNSVGNSGKNMTKLISGGIALNTTSTAAEQTGYETYFLAAYGNLGYTFGSTTSGNGQLNGSSNDTKVIWNFGRAPGFFDVVCYTGTGGATTQAHNLGVVPEMMIVKRRSTADNWFVYSQTLGNLKQIALDGSSGASGNNNDYWNSTSPTSTVFTVGIDSAVNFNGSTYVAYLFASCPGVSKVGSYTGTGTTLQVDCGFTGGARFVLIKRTDSTGDWYVWDSARGIVAGNDPYLLLNSTAAEVTNTDYVDTYSAGFEISSTAPAAINANGGTFIFLAIA
jgi:hypothetical protein